MKKYIFIFLIGLVTLTSCEDDFLDVNTDPTASTEVPPGTLLMNASIALSQNRLNTLSPDGAAYIQHHKPIVVLTAPDTYGFSEIGNNNFWEFSFYQDIIKDPNLGITLAEERGNFNVSAQLKLLQAFAWIHGVDRWGEMPFFQVNNPEFPNPMFDEGAEIYQGIIDLINEALDQIDLDQQVEPFTIVAFDHIYGGDMNKWEAFGNSLKLRALMRLSYVENRDAEISALLGSGVNFIDALDGSEDAVFRYFNNRPNQNFDYATFDNFTQFNSFLPSASNRVHQAWRLASNRMVTLLTDDNDPRLNSFFVPFYSQPDGYAFTGAVNGSAPLPDAAERGFVSPFYIRQDAPDVWFAASEYWLLVAEAYQRGLVSGDAQTAFANGVIAHMNIFDGTAQEISDADKDAYIAANTLASKGDATSFIQTELYKALFGNGVEAWSHWRRTKRPALTPAVGGPITTVISRIPLPQSPLGANSNAPEVSKLRDVPVFFERQE
ncbi:SusD/RagB family nutrient-binding outer membrane lipoprotein [Marivirga salinae]|uniref:SusD/RagB family nutrient-binding outer membrane lipoprotein n=1 Tax=Marivirga salinarum TaxID=3059078 RepID=A0AA51RF29_9BACT|nr:SusD/RagB family nutrient-binding outer membrane lipoprotein [Marivirga sp. BDSF4-3]WMN12600.1 SusD/RagB family nutrient-binding outer membrane lipoprotein [Marivirga sp. BDSF4-3]